MPERPAPRKQPPPEAGDVLGRTAGVVVWLAVLEVVLLARAAPEVVAGLEGGTRALATTLGLFGWFAVPIGVTLALVWPALAARVRPRALARRILASETPAAWLNHAASSCAAGLGATAVLAATVHAAAVFGRGFARAELAALLVALAAPLGVVLGLTTVPAVHRATARALARFAPTGRVGGLPTPLGVLLALVVAGLAAMWWAVASLSLDGLDVVAVTMGFAGLAFLLAVASAAPATGWARVRGWIAVSLVAACWPWTAVSLGGSADVARAVAQHGHLSRVALRVGRRVLDLDGDGHAALLGGGDCDDSDPAIGPHATEIPGNGVDDNCAGGDATAAPAPPPPPAPPPAPAIAAAVEAYTARPYNVLLVFVDTLRPDHLGTYGYDRETSPNLDALARRGAVFERVYSPAPNTPRAFPALLTGRTPSAVDWVERYAGYASIRAGNETLFEIFRRGGWRTEAQSAHWYFERADGLQAGVDRWDNEGWADIRTANSQTTAHIITPRAERRLEALADGGRPFVLMVHYAEPHAAYMNHPEVKVWGRGAVDRYDSEIRYVDHHLGALLETLRRTGLDERTIVVVTSDHGEAFGEHRHHFHGHTLFDEEVRIPLIVDVPGLPPRRIGGTAALVDVLPTLGALVGLAAPRADGLNLAPQLLTGAPVPDRLVVLEQLPYPANPAHLVGVVDTGTQRKLIRNLTDNTWSLFDLARDPEERHNLVDRAGPQLGPLRSALTRHIETDRGG